MPRIDLVIFDCDGVLVDSEVISAEVLVQILADDGFITTTDHVYRNYTGKSFPKVVDIVAQTIGRPLSEGFESKYREALFKAFSTRLRPTNGLLSILSDLAQPKCVATSSTPARVGRSLSLTGLADFFGQNVFTASQVANGKPAPDLFLLAAERMRADPSHCLVIEDSEVGLTAAVAAGMIAWRYTGGAHLSGIIPPVSSDLPNIRCFDNWAEFYQMAPELRR